MLIQHLAIRQNFDLTQLLSAMAGGNNNQSVILKNPHKSRGSALQLLIIFLTEYTATNRMAIEISVEKVLSLRQMQDTSYARKQIREDMDYLDQVQFSCRKRELTATNARIGAGNASVNKGVLYFSLHDSMKPLIPRKQFMLLPDSVLVTHRNENITARLLLTWRICQHLRMNLDRNNANRVPIRSLLECCPAIPSYWDLQYRQVNQKIIEPFEMALDKCQEYFSWEYDGDIPKDYQSFLDARILVTWNIDPYSGREDFVGRKAKNRG